MKNYNFNIGVTQSILGNAIWDLIIFIIHMLLMR